jgi:hypothetical protein
LFSASYLFLEPNDGSIPNYTMTLGGRKKKRIGKPSILKTVRSKLKKLLGISVHKPPKYKILPKSIYVANIDEYFSDS